MLRNRDANMFVNYVLCQEGIRGNAVIRRLLLTRNRRHRAAGLMPLEKDTSDPHRK